MPFLVGDRLYLRGLTEEDASRGAYPGWLNDEQVCHGNSHHRFPYSRESALEFVRDVRGDPHRLVLAMVLKESDRHIGNISLQGIDPISRSAELAILVGEKDTWGQGLSTEAARLIIRHGFRELNLHRVHLGTFSDNAGMLRLAEKLGMTMEGRRRESVFKRGRWLDVVEYGLLAHEFDE